MHTTRIYEGSFTSVDRLGKFRENESVLSMDAADMIEDVVTGALCARSVPFGAEFLAHVLDFERDIPSDATPKDLDWQYDQSTISASTYAKLPGSRYQVLRLQSLAAGTCKSLGIQHGAKMTTTIICDDGSSKRVDDELLLWRNGMFVPKPKGSVGFAINHRSGNVMVHHRTLTANANHETKRARMLLGLQWRSHFRWRVILGADRAGISLTTSPTATREFFKSRDQGVSGRRAALRNWVNGHWRRKATVDEDGEAKSWVRRHLRGTTDFKWNGLDCRIIVAPSDLAGMAKAD